MAALKKVWTNTAKAQLKAIYENYKVKSLQDAKTIKDEIVLATKEHQMALICSKFPGNG